MDLFIRWANRLIDASLGSQIDPGSVWVGLSTTVPGVDGSNWTEVPSDGYGGYARASLASLIPSASSGLASNNQVIQFPVPQSGGAVIAAVGLFDHPTLGPTQAGRMFSALQPALLIVAGQAPEIRASTLTLSAS